MTSRQDLHEAIDRVTDDQVKKVIEAVKRIELHLEGLRAEGFAGTRSANQRAFSGYSKRQLKPPKHCMETKRFPCSTRVFSVTYE